MSPTLPVDTPEIEADRATARGRVDSFLGELPARLPGFLELERTWEASLPAAVKKRQPAEVKTALDTPSEKRTPRQKHLLYELLLEIGGKPSLKTEHDRLLALKSRIPRPVTTMVVRKRATPPKKSRPFGWRLHTRRS